jgi:hypothetical protein
MGLHSVRGPFMMNTHTWFFSRVGLRVMGRFVHSSRIARVSCNRVGRPEFIKWYKICSASGMGLKLFTYSRSGAVRGWTRWFWQLLEQLPSLLLKCSCWFEPLYAYRKWFLTLFY